MFALSLIQLVREGRWWRRNISDSTAMIAILQSAQVQSQTGSQITVKTYLRQDLERARREGRLDETLFSALQDIQEQSVVLLNAAHDALKLFCRRWECTLGLGCMIHLVSWIFAVNPFSFHHVAHDILAVAVLGLFLDRCRKRWTRMIDDTKRTLTSLVLDHDEKNLEFQALKTIEARSGTSTWRGRCAVIKMSYANRSAMQLEQIRRLVQASLWLEVAMIAVVIRDATQLLMSASF